MSLELRLKEKRQIDKLIENAASNGMARITASYISDKEKIDAKKVIKRLITLAKDDKILINYELECPHCYRTVETFEDLRKIQKDIVVCPHCQEEFEVDNDKIWVTYSPNPHYYKDTIKNEKIEEKLKKKQCR